MLARLRTSAWVLLAFLLIAVIAAILVGSFHGAMPSSQSVAWATVAGGAASVMAILFVIYDKIKKANDVRDLNLRETEDDLATVVLAQAEVARSRLLGADDPGDRAANVHFVKGTGRFREVGGVGEGDLASVLAYYESLSPRRLVVVGEPGAGKTVLAFELLIQLLEQRIADKNGPVPVLISAAAYDTRQAWPNWLAKQLALRYTISAGVAARLIAGGRILPIIDGLDEMDPAGAPKRAAVLVTALNASMRGRVRAPVVVTCRRTEYQSLARKVDRATHVGMIPLSGDESADYLRDQFLDEEEQRRWQPVLANLHAYSDGPLAEQLGTPWRLVMSLVAYRDGGDPADMLPPATVLTATAARKYANRIDRWLLSHYVSSIVRRHYPDGHYDGQQVERWLAAIAEGLAWQGTHDRSAIDIRLDQWWEPTAPIATRILHSVVAALPAVPWVIVGIYTRNTHILELSGGLLIAAAFATKSSSKKLRLRGITKREGLWKLARGLVRGLAFGLPFSGVVGIAAGAAGAIVYARTLPGEEGYSIGVVNGLAYAFWIEIACIVASVLAFGTATLLADSSPEAAGPRDAIRSDGRSGIWVGFAFAVIAGGVASIISSLAFGIMAGITIGLVIGLGYGASTWTRYYVTVVIIAARRQGPLRFATFLDWAQKAGLLRTSGVAYQFRHRQLQDWLRLQSRHQGLAMGQGETRRT